MTLTEDITMAGIGMMVVAIALVIRAGLRAAKQRTQSNRQLPEEYPGLTSDAYMILFWSGMLLMQISNILLHAEPGGTYRVVPLMWVGTAAILLVFGLYAGRLMMRLEMRAYQAKREVQTREART